MIIIITITVMLLMVGMFCSEPVKHQYCMMSRALRWGAGEPQQMASKQGTGAKEYQHQHASTEKSSAHVCTGLLLRSVTTTA
jgi:hypothetical protein